jgi:hypothetical protein
LRNALAKHKFQRAPHSAPQTAAPPLSSTNAARRSSGLFTGAGEGRGGDKALTLLRETQSDLAAKGCCQSRVQPQPAYPPRGDPLLKLQTDSSPRHPQNSHAHDKSTRRQKSRITTGKSRSAQHQRQTHSTVVEKKAGFRDPQRSDTMTKRN